jgi:hypothetical protein
MSLGDGGLGVESLGGSDEDAAGGVTGDATSTLTLGRTAAGTVGKATGASRTLTISATAAGALGLRTGAAVALTIAVTASGVVTAGSTGDASQTLTVSRTAAGFVGRSTGAARTITLSTSAAGVLGLFRSASQTLTLTVDAAGTLTTPGMAGASLDLTITATAAGVVQANPQTLISVTGGRRRAGTASLVWEAAPTPVPRTAPVVRTYIVAHAHAAAQPEVSPHARLNVTTARARALRSRITAGGVDITYFRGSPTPPLEWQLIEPGLYGPARLTLPQIRAGWDTPGEGDLWFLAEDSPVVERLVNADGSVGEVLYRGFITDYNEDGPTWSTSLGGHLMGRAALQDRQRPVFPRRRDLSQLVLWTIRNNLRLTADGPEGGIGIDQMDTGGGMTQADWLNQMMAAAQKVNGTRYTLMPDENRVYQLQAKDTTTVHYTVYTDDAHCVRRFRRDFAAEPNRIYADAIREEGLRIDGAVWPGVDPGNVRPPYPLTNHAATLSPGSTDADTDTGDGVTLLINRLWQLGFIDIVDDQAGIPNSWDSLVTRGLKQAQRKASLEAVVLGVLDFDTWKALYDYNTLHASSLRGAKILPTSQDRRVDQWRRSASGLKMAKNPHYDPSVLPKDRSVSLGFGWNWNETQDISDQLLEDASSPNWVGELELPMGAVIAGDHNPGDPLTADMLVDSRLVKPGTNIKVANLEGGTLLHVSGNAGGGSLTVDTRARDAMEVWAIHERNQAAKHTLRRSWVLSQTRSGSSADSIQPWDRIGGRLGFPVVVAGQKWVRFPMVMGKEGQVRDLDMTLEKPACEWYLAIFGTNVHPDLMHDLVGDPSTDEGRRNWRRHKPQLREKHLLLYAAGTPAAPLGYDPSTKADVKTDLPWRVTFADGHHEIFETEARANKAADGHDGATVGQFGNAIDYVTGRWRDSAGFPYFVGQDTPGIGWVLVWADRDTHVKPGRLWTPQLMDQA